MRQLGLFAKYWEPGQVKTRLARSIGDEAAGRLYREFLSSTLETFRTFEADRVLAFSPLDKQLDFERLAGTSWNLAPQVDGNLGIRMQAYFAAAQGAGRTQTVLIGTDSPTLSIEMVQDAFEQLEQHDVVVGPTRDGGYYLVGCQQRIPDIFTGIDWGTAHVFKQTIRKLESTDLSYTVLPEWYDVDQLDDLFTLHRELTQPNPRRSWQPTLLTAVCQVVDKLELEDRPGS